MRIRIGIACGMLAAVASAVIAVSGKPWLRVLIAPAWRTGAITSGSIQAPNLSIVVTVAAALGFALGFLASMMLEGPVPHAKAVGANLIVLYIVAMLELAYYPSLAEALLRGAGAAGVLGGEYPLVFASRLLPGTLVFLIGATTIILLVLRYRPRRLRGTLLAVWLSQAAALLASVAWYVSPSGPGFP